MVFMGKESREILRTWRIWVLPGILLLFAVSGPPLARFTPQLVEAAVGNGQLGGLKIPTPTYVDSYVQWLKNLSQIGVLALIIVYGGLVNGELKSGTAVLMLTKPVSRTAFVVAKAAVHAAFLVLVVIAGTLITWGITAVIFGNAPGSSLWSATMAWLVLGVLFVGLMTLLSTLIASAAGAAGAGLGAYAVLLIAAIWKPLAAYSPAGLTAEVTSLAAGKSADVLWPVLTALMVAGACVALAGVVIRFKDL
jgi:ABC-2 type transport system permease protein